MNLVDKANPVSIPFGSLAAVMMAVLLSACLATAQKHGQLTDAVKFTFTLSKDRVRVDENVELRIEARNTSDHDVFVCRQFHTWGPCFMDVDLDPQVQERGEERECACPPLVWDALARSAPKSFEEALRDAWVSLPPRASYGVSIELTPRSFPQLKHAGKYEVVTKLQSHGLSTSGDCYHAMDPYVAEIAALSTKEWVGQQLSVLPIRVVGAVR